MTFRDSVADDLGVFICPDEFADEHDLNGTVCQCVVQSPTARETFLQGKNFDGYEGVTGRIVIVHVAKSSLSEVPRAKQVFTLDDEYMEVADCVDDMGMLSITLHQYVGVKTL